MNLCIDFKPFAEWVSRSCPSASSCHLQATSCSTSLIFASKSTWYLGCKSFIDKINFLVTDTLNTHPPPTLLISSFPIRRAVIHFSPRKLPYTERMLSLIELPLSVCLSVCLSLSLSADLFPWFRGSRRFFKHNSCWYWNLPLASLIFSILPQYSSMQL